MKTLGLMAVILAVAAFGSGLRSPNQASAQQAPDVVGTSAAFEVNLSALFAEHADLGLTALQKRHDGAPDFTAIAAQVDENGVAIARSLGLLYGETISGQFLAQWRRHITDYLMYTDGLVANNQQQQEQAVADLRDFEAELAATLATLLPGLSAAMVQSALTEHVNQTLSAISAYHTADYTQVYDIAHEGHMHMIGTGSMLAQAIVRQNPTRFAETLADDDVSGAATDTRLELVGLLTEHSSLAFMVMQKAAEGAPDLQAAAAQLSENTTALAAATSAIDASFTTALSARIAALMDFSNALASGNSALQSIALQTLTGSSTGLGSTDIPGTAFAASTSLEQSFGFHDDLLIRAITSFSSGDYATAYDLAHQAYMLAVRIGAGLATSMESIP